MVWKTINLPLLSMNDSNTCYEPAENSFLIDLGGPAYNIQNRWLGSNCIAVYMKSFSAYGTGTNTTIHVYRVEAR